MSDHRDANIDDVLTAEEDARLESENVDNINEPDPAATEESDILLTEQGAGADNVAPAELAAVHTDTEAAAEASGDLTEENTEIVEKKSAKKASVKTGKAAKSKTRSQKYLAAAGKVDINRRYSIKDAMELIKETSYTKFDGTVELHIKLVEKKTKDTERFRMVVALPHGTGKEPKIGVLDEELIAKIKQKGDTEFDILLASPSLMPKVAQIAKVLGPKGKMPNPKTGTVTDDPEAAKRAILSGRIELRADAQSIVHQAIGRVSWPVEKLVENYQVLVASIPAHRLQRLSVSATMGPGLQIAL